MAHILQELGFAVTRVGDQLHGSALVAPEMHVPGTEHLRTSILAAWADTLIGLLAVDVVGPRVPVTVELDVHLYRPTPGQGEVRAVGRLLRSGRSLCVGSVEFVDEGGEVFGWGAGSFMAAPDPTVRLPAKTSVDAMVPSPWRLRAPLAERAGCERREPGVAVLPRSDDGLNSSNTVNGGLLALVVEEAALSLAPGATLSSLGMRYLRPVRVGPVMAEADVRDGLGRVEVRDAGSDDRLAVLATTRALSISGPGNYI